MPDKQLHYASYIADSFIERRSNRFVEAIIGRIFRKIDFDEESLDRLKEYSGKGRIVYSGLITSNTSLLVFVNLLRRHGLKVPDIALGFSPYLIQKLTNLLRLIIRFITSKFERDDYKPSSNIDYIVEKITNRKSLIISLLSKKLFFRRYVDIRADALEYLIEAQKQCDEELFIFPYVFFWNLNPRRTGSILTSRATGDRGLLRAALGILRRSSSAFVRLSMPISVRQVISESQKTDTLGLARVLRDRLLEQYAHEKYTVLGPVIKSPQEMMEKVLYHPEVMKTIEELRSEGEAPVTKLRRKALKYFKEIAADLSIVYIEFFIKTLDYLFNRLFDGIYYNQEDFRKLRDASRNGPLVYIPSHRSHVDYLILASLLYKNRLAPPHICAGANLSFFPMGTIFRRSGAFFMRRSFKGHLLYSKVFRQYVKALVAEGYSIEFFIEGGRTRTGKIEPPKLGMIKYLTDAVDEGYNRDLMFVPISINYDRIVEETSYQKEIKGKEKKNESTRGLLKSRRFLSRRYGRVYVTIDDPLSYMDLKKKYGEYPGLVSDIGNHIITSINEISMASPVGIVATAIILQGVNSFTEDSIRNTMRMIHEYFLFNDFLISDILKDAPQLEDVMDSVVKDFSSDQILNIEEQEGHPVLIHLREDERVRINFYKNSLVFFLLPLSFTALGLLCSHKDGSISFDSVKDEYAYLLDFFKKEFSVSEPNRDPSDAINRCFSFFESYGVLKKDKDSFFIEKINDVLSIARLIMDFMESYYILYRTIEELKGPIKVKDLELLIRKKGSALYKNKEIKLIESLSVPNYRRAVSKAISDGVFSSIDKEERNAELAVQNYQMATDVRKRLYGYLSHFYQD